MKAPFEVVDGIYTLDSEWSYREREILQSCVDFLISRGFSYWQVPSSVRTETYRRQGIFEKETGEQILGQPVATSEHTDTGHRLAGSAEQGILERLSGRHVDETLRIVAHNTCFREEPGYGGLKRVREFQKVEQYMCTHNGSNAQEDAFNEILQNALDFLERIGLTHRRVINSDADPGYHIKKWDIEVHTEAYGWMETHSCSMFQTEQADRYGITGPCRYTLSNTGIASPRVLIPLMEREGIKVEHSYISAPVHAPAQTPAP